MNCKRFIGNAIRGDGTVVVEPHLRVMMAYLILNNAILVERPDGGGVEDGDRVKVSVINSKSILGDIHMTTVVDLLTQKARDGRTLELEPDAPLIHAARRVVAMMNGAYPKAIVTHALSNGGLRLIPRQDLPFIT